MTTEKTKVLVVDDHLPNLKLLSFLLSSSGFEVTTAGHADEAMAALEREVPRLILMDIQLPDVDGLTLTRRIKADPRTRDVVIVAVTAYAMKGDEERAREAGCDGYITKPIDTRALPAQLHALIGGPVPKPVVIPAAPPSTERSSQSGRATILVVEDNPITRKMVRFTLENAGFGVLEADSCASAIRLFTSEQVGLVLQDLGLSDGEGFALVTHLRSLPRGQEVPILAFSGMLTPQDESRISAAGFDDLISKPIEPSRLVQIVRSHLPDLTLHATDPFGLGRRLLVVDDDPVQRKLVGLKMQKAGFDVETAGDGSDALMRARVRKPHAILSDVLMPNLDGFGLCIEIGRDPELQNVPVVLTTNSYVEATDRDLARRAGARDLIVRTPELREVLACLRNNLGTSVFIRPTDLQGAPEEVDAEHTRRMVRQLERHVALNQRISQRCTFLAAEISVIRGIAEALASHEDIDTALRLTLAACFDAGGISLGALFLSTIEGMRVLSFGFSDLTKDGELQTFFGEPDLLKDVMAGTTTLVLSGLGDQRVMNVLRRAVAGTGVLAPLHYKGMRLGALFMLSRNGELENDDRVKFSEAVAGQISQALAVAEAFRHKERSERVAREQASLLESILESIGDGLVVTNATGKVIRWNSNASELVKLLEAEEAGAPRGRQGIFESDHTTRVPSPLLPTTRTDPSVAIDGVEVFARFPDTTEGVWLSASARPWRDDKGETRGRVSVFRDVTREKATRTHLMASDRMASVGLLAAGVAHEINNPLTSVMTNLELAQTEVLDRALAGDTNAAKELRDMLADATEAASRVKVIVRDLKVFSRDEESQTESVDLKKVLDSTLRMGWNEVRHRAQLVKDYDDAGLVVGSESRLGQVFLNLLVNAAQAIPEGNAEGNSVRVSARHTANGMVAVEISDSGVGIPAENLRNIFLPFYTTKAPGVGTGLGLAICHGIVKGFGGEIEVESEPGVGTTFRVLLQTGRRDAIATVPEPPAPSPLLDQKARVLVIDDEPLMISSIRRVLRNQHEVTSTTRADEAVEWLRAGQHFDVILCDLMMPQMTGMEFYAALTELGQDLTDRVVFLSGGAFTAAARAFLDTIPDQRLDKPFDPIRLRALVAEVVRRNRP